MLAGYGFCILVADFILVGVERLWTFHFQKRWTTKAELLYLISLFFLTSIMVYIYDLIITKQTSVTWSYFANFSFRFTFPFALLLLPLVAYVRVKYGKILSKQQLFNPTLILLGQNKEDYLQLSLQQLLCIKAEDNYVRIIYLEDENMVKEVLMRNTLATMAEQAQKLIYCHRSYLVAHWHITEILGNKQKASIVLKHYSKELPLSSAHFSTIRKLIK